MNNPTDNNNPGLKNLLETHKTFLESATPATDTVIRSEINSKLDKILVLIPEKSKNPEEQSKEPEPVEPKQPDEITELISLIDK